MSKSKICGVYAITNKINNKKYIGSSKSVHYRWKQQHYPELKNGKHCNTHLQRAWNKDKEENFQFEVIEECPIDCLVEREGYWIECFQSWNRKYGYNLCRIVDGRHVIDDETRRKMRKHPNEFYNKIVELYKQGVSKNSIAQQLNVDRALIYHHLEAAGLYENHGRGKGLKLTPEVQQKIKVLRNEGITWKEILQQIGISRTQIYRTNLAKDGMFHGNKRDKYRTVTPEIIEKVEQLRNQNKTWEQIQHELGVSYLALQRNGVTQQFQHLPKVPGKKLTEEKKLEIIKLRSLGKSTKEISIITGVPQSTIRLHKLHKALCL